MSFVGTRLFVVSERGRGTYASGDARRVTASDMADKMRLRCVGGQGSHEVANGVTTVFDKFRVADGELKEINPYYDPTVLNEAVAGL